MTSKQQKLINESTFLFELEKEGLKGHFTFVKLILIFMLCCMGFNVSAQTPLQIQIQNATPPDGRITISGYTTTNQFANWYVARKSADGNYALLISYYPLSTTVVYSVSGNSDYMVSGLRTEMNSDYPYLPQVLRDIAVVPDLTAGNTKNINDKSVVSQPTSMLPANPTTDMLFAPSYQDVYIWNGNSENPLQPYINNYYPNTWWLRSTVTDGSDMKFEVQTQADNGMIGYGAQNYGTLAAVGAIWVKISPITVTISGAVFGAPKDVQISYTIGGAAQTPVTTTGGYYSIPDIPYGSNVTITPEDITGYEWYVSPTPDISNVTMDISKKNIYYYIPGFTVNDVNYTDVDGKNFCDNLFTFKADPNIPDLAWTLDGTKVPSSGAMYSFTRTLSNGYHTITLDLPTFGKTYTVHFYAGAFSVIWTPGTSGTDDDKRNWNIAANWTPAVIPSSCDTVYIPGNLAYYPMLDDANPAECLVIYFLYGAELGRPDLLTYQRAFVQYNFGLSEFSQNTGSNQNLVLTNNSTYDRMLYSGSFSATPMTRERWYMLAAPLKSVVTGDLDFGGFPLTFLKKFGPVDKNTEHYLVGEWTTPYNSMNELVSPTGTEGFAFFMYSYLSGGSATRNAYCFEDGAYGNYNENDYIPNRNGKSYGIRQTNGILELPFFADSTNLVAHRTQVYNQPASTFYYVYDGVNDLPSMYQFTGTTELVTREANDENYRFAPENRVGADWVFQNPIVHPTTGLSAGDEFLVGNPYMSSIDMVEFCKDNPSVEPSFRIWNGNDFDTYSVDISTGEVTPTNPGTSPYISPLQGFFLKYTGSGSISFDVKHISTVRKTLAFNLRSSQATGEENLLRIKADNGSAASYTVIAYKEGASNGYVAGEDVQKLFSPLDYVPSIFSLTDDIPVDFNFINDSGNITIPLGIKTGQTGGISLTFTGMDNYDKALKIELIDALEDKTIDLTKLSSYTYSFNNTETGILNGRFSLRVSTSLTSIHDVNSADNLNVYGDSKGIYVVSSEPVQKLEIFDISGKKLYESDSDAKYYPLEGFSENSPLIVIVISKNKMKTVKINL